MPPHLNRKSSSYGGIMNQESTLGCSGWFGGANPSYRRWCCLRMFYFPSCSAPGSHLSCFNQEFEMNLIHSNTIIYHHIFSQYPKKSIRRDLLGDGLFWCPVKLHELIGQCYRPGVTLGSSPSTSSSSLGPWAPSEGALDS